MEVSLLNLKVNKISDAEAEIMRVVWEHPGPVTYSYIRTVLTQQKNWGKPHRQYIGQKTGQERRVNPGKERGLLLHRRHI